MKLLLLNDLVEQGISATEIQKSLTLTCFAKTFRRQSVLPKKFKEKALNICQEMGESGQETFILETNYSYTIWVEEEKIKEQKKTSINLKVDNKEIIQNDEKSEMTPSFRDKTEINSKQTFIPSTYNLFDIVSSNDLQDNVREIREDKKVSSISGEILEEVKTYRGVVVNQSLKSQPIVEETSLLKQKIKPRTYRGITY
jgi:hypothetical protein